MPDRIIWTADFWFRSGLGRAITCPRTRNVIGNMRAYRAVRGLPQADLPNHIRFQTVLTTAEPRHRSPLGDCALISGGIMVLSERAADTIAGFDLGATRLPTVELRGDGGETVIERRFWLNLAETKETFIPDLSHGPNWVETSNGEPRARWRPSVRGWNHIAARPEAEGRRRSLDEPNAPPDGLIRPPVPRPAPFDGHVCQFGGTCELA